MNEKEFDIQQQIKSRERVRDLAEVFTAEREVNEMLDLVKQQSYDLDSRFLEPSCGNGNFLVAILQRKLKSLETHCRQQKDYEYGILRALASIYGVDISEENIEEARERLKVIALLSFSTHLNTSHCSEGFLKAMDYILTKNIFCGDMLNGQAAISFHEFIPENDYSFSESSYQLSDMLTDSPKKHLIRPITPYWVIM